MINTVVKSFRKPLKNGEKVMLQHGNKWVPASKHPTPRSYIVQTPEG